MKNYAIIVAGGKSKRMGAEKNKCLIKLLDKEVLIWTLETFIKTDKIDGFVLIMANDNEVSETKQILANYKINKNIIIIKTEGEYRQDGVYAGIKALDNFNVSSDDIILIHNGANPFVSQYEILESIDKAKIYGASVCAYPVKDTIKEVSKDCLVEKTLDRQKLWAMQTPQTIKYDIAKKAFEKAYEDYFYGTDDVQLVERINEKVYIVQCSYENFKITTQTDLFLAEKIIKTRM